MQEKYSFEAHSYVIFPVEHAPDPLVDWVP